MKLNQLRKIIREEVKAAVKEELQDILNEAVKVASTPTNEAKSLNDKLVSMLEKFRSLTGDIWTQTTLVMGYKCNFSKGI